MKKNEEQTSINANFFHFFQGMLFLSLVLFLKIDEKDYPILAPLINNVNEESFVIFSIYFIITMYGLDGVIIVILRPFSKVLKSLKNLLKEDK